MNYQTKTLRETVQNPYISQPKNNLIKKNKFFEYTHRLNDKLIQNEIH